MRHRRDMADMDVGNIEAVVSARRTAWWIGPKVEPQPTTTSRALSAEATSCPGMESATLVTLAARCGHLVRGGA